MKKVLLMMAVFGLVLIPAKSWAGHKSEFSQKPHGFYKAYRYHGTDRYGCGHFDKCGYWCKKHRHHRYSHYKHKRERYSRICNRRARSHRDYGYKDKGDMTNTRAAAMITGISRSGATMKTGISRSV